MTIDNLNCLLKKFTFLREHHPSDRSILITIANECIDISIALTSPRRSWTIQAPEESISNEYDIFPVIKDILSYFGLTHKNFGRLVIGKMNQNVVKFTICISNYWRVGETVYRGSDYDYCQRIKDLMEEDLPIPLSEEKINKAREAEYERIKSSFSYYNQYIDLEELASNIRVEPISVATSASTNAASLNF